MNEAPIGIFDSGVGGLTVARAIIDQLPHESIHYVGDTAHGPYGPRPLAQVRELALSVMDSLADDGVKMLVIACNTASAAVLRDARERFAINRGIPVVEVVYPAVRRALATTKSGRIGVIGTQATIGSRVYQDALEVVPSVEVTANACPEFVTFVEEGLTSGGKVEDVARGYLSPLIEAQVDTLVLGCTHYPMLTGVISYVMGEEVTLVSSADATANDVYRQLVAHDLVRDPAAGVPEHRFMTTSESGAFTALARRFLGPVVGDVRQLGAPV